MNLLILLFAENVQIFYPRMQVEENLVLKNEDVLVQLEDTQEEFLSLILT
jgi:hypothetical protein